MVDAAGTGGARDPWLLGLIAARAVTVRPVALASGPLIGLALALGFALSDVAAEAGGVGGRGCQRPRARPTRERPPARQPHPLVLLHAVRNPLGASLGLPTCPLTRFTLFERRELAGVGRAFISGQDWHDFTFELQGDGTVRVWVGKSEVISWKDPDYRQGGFGIGPGPAGTTFFLDDLRVEPLETPKPPSSGGY